MKKIVFTEAFCKPGNLWPFTLTRQIQDIRIGILTIREKWEQHLGLPSSDKFENDYKDLSRAIVIDATLGSDIIYLIHGNVLPTKDLAAAVLQLQPGEALSVLEKESIVYCISKDQIVDSNNIKVGTTIPFTGGVNEVKAPWDIFKLNAWAINQDVELLTEGRVSQTISQSNHIANKAAIFIEEGARVEACYINAEEGPVYIGPGATIMQGSMLSGPVAVCNNAVVKMGAKIYGGTTIGPNCIAGGEIKNAVMFANSNKAHDGYMGNAVIGEWCNWGAGTSNSNIKNNASDVMVWTPTGPVNVGTKCGVFMGDYSRTAINTSINTGTMIGACANVFGSGLTPKYIPSFSWGSDGLTRYQLQKAVADIDNWKRLKGAAITADEKVILKYIFENW